jgi:hypothetical protein
MNSTIEIKDSLKIENSDSLLISCNTIPKTIKHKFKYRDDKWEREITLPLFGRFVEESHYVTNNDKFESGLWPNDSTENIESHLNRSFEIYKKFDTTMTFVKLYDKYWHKEWTPAEGGHFGQGSIGNIQLEKLSPETELWLLTMMWAPGQKPEPGTKFILSANGKSVIVAAGYETGPADKTFIGGITREVHAWLGSNSKTEIKIEFLENQKLIVGPTNCKH